MSHLGAGSGFLYEWGTGRKRSLEEVRRQFSLDAVWTGHLWNNPSDVRTYAEWGILAVQEFTNPFPNYKFDTYNGVYDVFVYNELASMSALVRRISWSSLPEWYIRLMDYYIPGEGWERIHERSKKSILPIEWQYYNISSKQVIESAMDNVVTDLESTVANKISYLKDGYWL